MSDEPETKKSVLPYKYYVYPHKVLIEHPSGAKMVLHESQIRSKLDGVDHPMRPLSSHETIMLETAWSLLQGKNDQPGL